MIAIVAADDLGMALETLRHAGEDAWELGEIADGSGEVRYL